MPNTPMPWIKLYTRLLNDPEIRTIPPRACWRYVQLLLYAGTLNEGGLLESDNRYISYSTLQDVLLSKSDVQKEDEERHPHETPYFEDDLKWLVVAGLIEAIDFRNDPPIDFFDGAFQNKHYTYDPVTSKTTYDPGFCSPDDFSFRITRWEDEQEDLREAQEKNRARQTKWRKEHKSGSK